MHSHFSGLEGVKVSLYVIAILGTMNLLAMKFKDSSSFWASWANLFGIN
jgi:hypothetical protein